MSNCVELATCDKVHIRDSKRPEGGFHTVSREVFAEFAADIKSGRYDGP